MVNYKGKKILLASGDTSCSEIIIMLLKSWGYEPVWVKESNEAAQAVARITPDLIIIDHGLGSKDGFKVVKDLKSNYHTAHIPILMMIEKKNMRRDILEIEHGLDDYLPKPPDPIDLEVRIDMALRRTEHQFFANPLTRLPGSRSLEKCVNQKLDNGETFSFLYCDINNFKSFNDKYGYKCGDAVITQTAHIITSALKAYVSAKDPVFHIGGDDFVILTTPSFEADIAKLIIDEFDKLIPFHYSLLDRHRGHIRIKDRRGKICDFDLMGISIAIVNNLHRKINSLIEFIEIAFEIKSYLKKHKKSRSLVNRRKVHPKEVIEHIIDDKEKQELHISANKQNSYSPLGQVLLTRNLITPEELDNALARHWNSSMRLGQVLLDMKIVEQSQLEEIFKEFNLKAEESHSLSRKQ